MKTLSKKWQLNRDKPVSLYLGMLATVIATIAAITFAPIPAHAESNHGDWGKDKQAEFHQKRLESLHNALKLTSAQEAGWHTFTEETKPNAKQEKPDRLALAVLPTPERLDRMLAMMKIRQQHMEAHVQAVKHFYGTLNADQQKTFDEKFAQHFGRHDDDAHHKP